MEMQRKVQFNILSCKLVNIINVTQNIISLSVLKVGNEVFDIEVIRLCYTLEEKCQIRTRQRALHARMSHSTVCNKTVSTKKTLRALVE